MTEQATTPETEEMTTIRGLFDRAANAIVDASRLGKEVEELRNAVSELRAQVESLRESNRWLDEQITGLRRQRDDALAEASEAKHQLSMVSAERDSFKAGSAVLSETVDRVVSERDNLDRILTETNDALTATAKEKDETYTHWQQSEEALHRTKDTLGAAQDYGSKWHDEAVRYRQSLDEANSTLAELRKHIANIHSVLSPPQTEPEPQQQIAAHL